MENTKENALKFFIDNDKPGKTVQEIMVEYANQDFNDPDWIEKELEKCTDEFKAAMENFIIKGIRMYGKQIRRMTIRNENIVFKNKKH
jgi:hypothetical protein